MPADRLERLSGVRPKIDGTAPFLINPGLTEMETYFLIEDEHRFF